MSGHRVLMVAPTPFFADRGCHVRILEEMRALQALGHAVTLCTYHHGATPSGLDVHRTPNVPWYQRLAAGPSIHKPYVDLLLLASALRRGRAFRPDVIHAHLHEGAALGIVLRRALGAPLVVDLQGSLAAELADHGLRAGWAQASFRSVERWLDRVGDAVVVSTAVAGKDARAMGVPPERLHLVPDGIDLERFGTLSASSRRQARRMWGLDADRPVVVFTGVLTPHQGIEFLLQAAESLRSAPGAPQFAIAGFPEIEWRREAERRGLSNVVFFGRVAYERMGLLLALSDVAVSPKMSATEGNLKLYSYMAAGLPVVAFDNTTNRDILGDAGCLVEPGNVLAFTAEIARLLASPERRAEAGEALRTRVAETSLWRVRAQQLAEIYDVVAGPRPVEVREAAPGPERSHREGGR